MIALLQYVREKYTAEGATVGPNLRVEFESKSISLELPSVDVILNDGWKIIPLIPPEVRKLSLDCLTELCKYVITARLHTVQITKEVVDSYSFENGWGIPSCQLLALWTAQSRPSRLIHTVTLKGTKKPSYFSIVLDSDTIPLASGGELPMYQSIWKVIYNQK